MKTCRSFVVAALALTTSGLFAVPPQIFPENNYQKQMRAWQVRQNPQLEQRRRYLAAMDAMVRRVEWERNKAGRLSNFPHVVYGMKEGTFAPALGYQWAPDSTAGNPRVVWVPGVLYPDLHVVSGSAENTIVPQPGYQWRGEGGSRLYGMGVADIAAGLAVVGAIQVLSDRFGRDIDRFLPEKGFREGDKSHEGREGRESHGGYGGGRGVDRSTGPGAHDRY